MDVAMIPTKSVIKTCPLKRAKHIKKAAAIHPKASGWLQLL
jgi:hypothetical protein